jgi:hypothetical protein
MRANVVRNGKYPTLVRMVNVDYFPTLTRSRTAAGRPARIAELIAHDGRPFWNTPKPTGPAVQPSKAGQPLLTNIIKSGAAEKFDFLLRPPAPGKYTISIQFLHWITKVLAGHGRLTLRSDRHPTVTSSRPPGCSSKASGIIVSASMARIPPAATAVMKATMLSGAVSSAV